MTTSELSRVDAILAAASKEAGGGFLCAVSGGRDSMCLLHAVAAWCEKNGGRVGAAHFNHQLRENADRDEQFVRSYCEEKKIPFFSALGECRGRAEAYGETLEEAARNLRYAFLEKTRAEVGCDWILTAHHADDNAETVLLNLVRGTGLRGLAGIPPRRGRILRPFLEISRNSIDAYAAAHGVPFVEDETNETDDHTRNLLRHKVLPVLKECNPRASENIARAARLLQKDAEALRAAAAELRNSARIEAGTRAEIDCETLANAPDAVTDCAILSLLAAACGGEKDLAATHAEAVRGVLSRGGQVSLPCGVIARREGGRLVIEKTAAQVAETPIAVGQSLRFGEWTVTLAPSDGGTAISLPKDAALTLSAWRSADRLNGRTIKRLCTDRGVAPHERDRLPVLRCGGTAVAAAMLGRDEQFAPNMNETETTVIFWKETEERET